MKKGFQIHRKLFWFINFLSERRRRRNCSIIHKSHYPCSCTRWYRVCKFFRMRLMNREFSKRGGRKLRADNMHWTFVPTYLWSRSTVWASPSVSYLHRSAWSNTWSHVSPQKIFKPVIFGRLSIIAYQWVPQVQWLYLTPFPFSLTLIHRKWYPTPSVTFYFSTYQPLTPTLINRWLIFQKLLFRKWFVFYQLSPEFLFRILKKVIRSKEYMIHLLGFFFPTG